VTERGARIILGLLSAGLVTIALTTDLASLSGGRFWGDGATYHAMAWSLAEDLDLRYEAKDVFRSRREFSEGPQGIFLKRSSGGLTVDTVRGFPWFRRVPSTEPRIYFAKPFVYPALAAPFVRVFGTRGLLLTNAFALAVALLLGYGMLRLEGTPGRALGASAALILGTVAPLYLLWPAPEALGVGLAAAGLYAWRRDWPWVAAVAFGIAAYSKPPNVLLALPLCLGPLLQNRESVLRRLSEGTRRGVVVLLVAASLYGVNWAATGEWNYQGGRERKTFYGKFPFESYGVTFGNSGIWMSTNQLGPRVEGKDEVATSQGSEPPRSRDEIGASFARNLGYFWIGRFGGVVPYFLPVAAAILLFAFPGPRSHVGWLSFAALAVSQIAYIAQIPDNWYGGSGTVGNRYFLNLLPLAFLLVPRGREAIVGVSGLVSLGVFTGSLLIAPIHHSLNPGDHATRWPFRWFPAELTMLNDLSIFGEPWRKKVPVGDPYGDPRKPGSGDVTAYFLYFPDNGTFGREEFEGRTGFWLRGGQRAEVFLRALEPVRRMTFLASGGPVGDELSLSLDGREATIPLRANETRNVVLEPAPGFPYKDTFVHILRLHSARGGSVTRRDGSEGVVGSFVSVSLEVERRPPH
jgi:hypothetical protein